MDFVLPILSQSALKVSIYTAVFNEVADWGRFYVSCMYLGSSTGLRTTRLVSMCMQMISSFICPSSHCRHLSNIMRSEHFSKLVQLKFELRWSPTDLRWTIQKRSFSLWVPTSSWARSSLNQSLSGFWNQAYFQRPQSRGMVLKESPREHPCEHSLQ